MINQSSDLNIALDGTLLSGRKISRMNILETGEYAFAIKVASSEMQTVWEAARDLFSEIRMWPVVSTLWGRPSEDWESSLLEEDFFSRFYFKEESEERFMPSNILEDSNKVELTDFMKQRLIGLTETEDFEAYLKSELEETRKKCGASPMPHILKNVNSQIDLEELLLFWEEENNPQVDPAQYRRQWYRQDPSVLLFLPVSRGWNSLAYIHWYGANQASSAKVIALGRRWEQKYGAELVAHYGTMIGCFVRNPPQTLEDAFELAKEHYLVAPYEFYVSGLSLRDYARGLVGCYSWFLHERP